MYLVCILKIYKKYKAQPLRRCSLILRRTGKRLVNVMEIVWLHFLKLLLRYFKYMLVFISVYGKLSLLFLSQCKIILIRMQNYKNFSPKKSIPTSKDLP